MVKPTIFGYSWFLVAGRYWLAPFWKHPGRFQPFDWGVPRPCERLRDATFLSCVCVDYSWHDMDDMDVSWCTNNYWYDSKMFVHGLPHEWQSNEFVSSYLFWSLEIGSLVLLPSHLLCESPFVYLHGWVPLNLVMFGSLRVSVKIDNIKMVSYWE